MQTETIHYLTQAELRRLLQSLPSSRDQALFRLAYTYGLRASEVGLLRHEDVDFNRLRIRIRRLKGSISSEYPLRPEVAQILKKYLKVRHDHSPVLFVSRQGNPISRRTLDYLMKRYGQKAGIPENKRHFHALKHSIAVHLLDAGMDIMFIKDWLGHKRIHNTMTYAQLSNKTREGLARKMFASSKIV